jgi:AhpC/TSA family
VPISQLPAVAPEFTLDHILGHKVSLSDYKGRKVVVTFGGRLSAPQIEQGIGTIRKTYDPDELPIIGVSDLRAAPRPARILVKNQIKKAYEGAVKAQDADLAAMGKPARTDPSKDVVMLLDWSGGVTDQFGVTDAENEAAAVVVDGEGKVIGSGTGTQLGEQVLAVLPAI